MKTELTFAQVAHHYLRSEIKMIGYGYDKPLGKLVGATKDFLLIGENETEIFKYAYLPIFQPFENLIKPVKANKFVAELLGINEGDEYVMKDEINKITNSYNAVIIDEAYCLSSNILRHIFEQPIAHLLLIAAGYNVYEIKDCKYEKEYLS